MNDYEELILEALYNKDVISEELYMKCSKPHISSLPYDHRRGRTMEELTERYNALNDRMKDLREERENLVKKSKENSDYYYENKRQRDELIDLYKDMKKGNNSDKEELDNLMGEIKLFQREMDDTLKEGRKISKAIKKWDSIAHDLLEDQRKIKWTAFKNGLLDLSPEDTEKAWAFVKSHGL